MTIVVLRGHRLPPVRVLPVWTVFSRDSIGLCGGTVYPNHMGYLHTPSKASNWDSDGTELQGALWVYREWWNTTLYNVLNSCVCSYTQCRKRWTYKDPEMTELAETHIEIDLFCMRTHLTVEVETDVFVEGSGISSRTDLQSMKLL